LSQIIKKIAAEIGARGAISFARFMELALYCPDCGFYEKEKDNVGKHGDFFTSVSVGDLFGQLLAFQFADWFEGNNETPERQSGLPRRSEAKAGTRETALKIVETGAHDGQLARDILTWLKAHRPALFHRLEYCIVEPSLRRREWQQQTLKDFSSTTKWVSEISELKSSLQSSEAIIFSNELLDAMPVHRLGWDAKEKKWFEWGVSLNGENFTWSRLPANSNHVSHFTFHGADAEKLFELLPDGYTVEISPAAENWWRSAAEVLAHGKLMTIDYGFTADEQFSPSRLNGTLRAYHRHQVTDNVLANVGEQDLTAHVNFSAIQGVGESAGLRTETFCIQPQFLTRIVEKIFQQPGSFGGWSPKRSRQLQTLTHPEHLGRAFRVLVQSR
jgi:SAM-dependent MidA family methyltransferase